VERIISVTDLVRNVARIAKEVETEGTIYRITRGGRGSMVLVDEEYFEAWMAAIEEMQRPGWREALEEGRRDVAAGRGRDLDTIVKELGLEDQSDRKSRKPSKRAAGTGRPKGRPSATNSRGRTSKR
jgi:PHD/YefM family antitoxin component YafN of YafNO toxin-antitoxin module